MVYSCFEGGAFYAYKAFCQDSHLAFATSTRCAVAIPVVALFGPTTVLGSPYKGKKLDPPDGRPCLSATQLGCLIIAKLTIYRCCTVATRASTNCPMAESCLSNNACDVVLVGCRCDPKFLGRDSVTVCSCKVAWTVSITCVVNEQFGPLDCCVAGKTAVASFVNWWIELNDHSIKQEPLVGG